MKPMNLERVVRNVDRRLARVEQILPTLVTREELDRKLDEKMANLVTKEELDLKLDERIAPLATKQELAAVGQRLEARIAEEGERSRTYTKIHYEDLKDDIRLLADGVVKVQGALDHIIIQKLENHDRRITALEIARGPGSGPHGRG